MKHFFIFYLFLQVVALQAQNRYYVNATASGANTGLSWPDAFTELQKALQTAQPGDEVWVAQGLYFPDTSTDRSISFELSSGVKLYGGFAGTETVLGERDWQAHLTVLSGDIGTPGDSTDNTYNVVYMLEPDTSTLLDGFVIRDGAATYSGGAPSRDRRRCGGGLYIMGEDGDAYPDIRNCRFLHNTAFGFGGGVMVNGGSDGSVAPRFIRCVFELNRTMSGSGGGVARFGGSWVERGNDFDGCVFLKNRSGFRGAGFYYVDSERLDRLDIYNCEFRENQAKDDGGGAFLSIGRLNPSGYTIRRCSFIGNMADAGGAFTAPDPDFDSNLFEMDSCVVKGNIHVPNNSSQSTVVRSDIISEILKNGTLRNTVFEENIGWTNIAYLQFPETENFTIHNILIRENETQGSLIHSDIDPEVTISNSAFIYNNTHSSLCLNYGHTFYLNCNFSNNNIGPTGAYFPSEAPLTLLNCTFANNNIGQTMSPGSASYSQKVAYNCVLSGIKNKYKFLYTDNYAEYNHCYFDTIDCNILLPYIHCGPGNIVGVDPFFRDTASGDYSLLPCSPLINMGLDSAAAGILTDIAGAPRIQGGRVDIGAYETPAFALAAAPAVKPACAGASDGSISLQPIFGCEPYTYQWTPAAGSGPELNGLPPGQYLLNLSDGAGRQIIDTIVVPEVPKPGLSLLATDVICGQPEGGSLKALVAGGTPPFHYEWQPPATDTGFLSQRAPGDYALTLSDANGCRDSATARLTLSGLLTLLVDGQGISCYQASDGWLSAQPQNGAGPFDWHWLGWNGTDSIASALEPGQYAVTVSDAYGCTAAFTFPYMDQPDSLWAIATVSPQTEHNPANGAAAVNVVSGGTAPYDFNWSSGATDQALTGLSAGGYMVTVTDEHGCTTALEVWIDSMFTTTKEVAGEYWLLWPNPAGDWLELRFQSAVPDGNLELWSEEGKMLFSWAIYASACRLDLRSLPAGGFDVLVRDASGRVLCSKRVVKR